MAKPIPVFAFAFAAFAATSVRSPSESRRHTSADPEDFFLSNWRASAHLDARFAVKVAVDVASEPTYRLRDRASSPANAAYELWLTDIIETSRGFSGVVSTETDTSQTYLHGRQLGFQLRHILGWRLTVNTASAGADSLPAPPSPAQDKIMADLDIS